MEAQQKNFLVLVSCVGLPSGLWPDVNPTYRSVGGIVLTDSKKTQIINSVLGFCPEVIAIYLFGSQVTQTANKASDVDVAILLPSKIEETQRWELAQKLAIELNQDVDLILLNKASTVFRFEIISQGKLLYSADDVVRQRFEMVVYSMYYRFLEERKKIVEEIRNRGSIY